MGKPARDCQLYLLSPPEPDLPRFAIQLEEALAASPVTAAGEARVAAFLLRLENADEAQWRAAISTLQPICAAYDTPFILTEQLDMVVEYAADGVHVIEGGTSVAEARKRLGAERIVGKSCLASRDAAMKAGDAGADYVLFNAFYQAETNARQGAASPDILAWWQEFFILPCVAAGGVTPANCRPLVMAGADFIMPLDAIWKHPDGVTAAVKAFDTAIIEALQNI
jgi:thiamine-phosphate pyrophosphorylase